MHALPKRTLVALLIAVGSASSHATNLVDDFLAASRFEPAYTAKQFDGENMRIEAQIASGAYYPRAGVTLSQGDSDSGTRRTFRITQPIVDAGRWLTRQEAAPKEALATHLDTQAKLELAVRVFASVRAMASAREKLALNEANLAALQAQASSAKLALDVGQGTITDVLDTQLRVTQARSAIQRLRADLQAAQRVYASITGYAPAPGAYPLQPRNLTQLRIPPLADLINESLAANPALQAQRLGTQLSQIEARRARAQFLPSLNATLQRSRSSSGSTSSINGVVISFDMPLQHSTLYSLQVADNKLLSQQAQERATQEQLLLELQRLHAQAMAAQEEVAITREGIDAAQASVKANEQSFEGGVRSKIDVLNALQSLLVAREAHLSAQLQLADQMLTLHLLAAQDIPTVLGNIQQQLFATAPAHDSPRH
jgi:protease secretion system outer membrane protein